MKSIHPSAISIPLRSAGYEPISVRPTDRKTDHLPWAQVVRQNVAIGQQAHLTKQAPLWNGASALGHDLGDQDFLLARKPLPIGPLEIPVGKR